MPGFIGIQEIVLLVVLLLLIFGARRLPEMGRSLGRGMREFMDGVHRKERDVPLTDARTQSLTPGLPPHDNRPIPDLKAP